MRIRKAHVAGAVAAVPFALIVWGYGYARSASGGTGLPHTSDYHSLLVNPSNPNKLILGTHQGLYVSSDGGHHWRFDKLADTDAMNLARPSSQTIWLAGHMVFTKSTDGGASWQDVRPSGLPSLDIHGFAVDPGNADTLYAAVAGEGLYRSTNGGRSFALASKDVGGNVFALAATSDGRILAGDLQRGLFESKDGGKSWHQVVGATILGLAINPSDPRRIIAGTAGIALSTDGGRKWRLALNLPKGVGPVAWSKSSPRLAYAVGLNRVFYRSRDGGVTWHPVR